MKHKTGSANPLIGDIQRSLKIETASDDQSRLPAARDWWPQALHWDDEEIRRQAPCAIARPAGNEEIAKILHWAGERGVAVTPRGGGSGVCGAAIATSQDSIALDTTKLNRVGPIEPDSQLPTPFTELRDDGNPAGAQRPNSQLFSLRVGAGVFGGALESTLNAQGYSLLHFPASLDISTVGGWIACGSYGQFSTLYGGIAGQTREIRAILPDGSEFRGPAQNFLESEGTLGIITEATLLVRKKPSRHFFLSYEFDNLSEALIWIKDRELALRVKPAVARLYDPLDSTLSGLKSSGGHFLADEFLLKLQSLVLRHGAGRRILKAIAQKKSGWVLVLIFEEEQEAAYRELLNSHGSSERRLSEEPAKIWWNKRYQWNEKKLKLMFDHGCFADTVDTWAPWDRLDEVYERFNETVSPCALSMGHISHMDAEGACLYMSLAGAASNAPGARRLHEAVWRAALDAVAKAGGRINHHHGIGLAKLPWIQNAWGEERLRAHQNKKREWDPKGIMNPGKLSVERGAWSVERQKI
ncbi:MAG: FAD-binding oxidoreductase [Elusimicrobiota bacterium]